MVNFNSALGRARGGISGLAGQARGGASGLAGRARGGVGNEFEREERRSSNSNESYETRKNDIPAILKKKNETPFVFVYDSNYETTTDAINECQNNGCNLQIYLNNANSFKMSNPNVADNNNSHLILKNFSGTNYVTYNGIERNHRFNLDTIYIYGPQADRVVVDNSAVSEIVLNIYGFAIKSGVSQGIQDALLIISVIAEGTTNYAYQNQNSYKLFQGFENIPSKGRTSDLNFSGSFPFNLLNMLPNQKSFFTMVLPENIENTNSVNYIILERKIYIPMDFLNKFKEKVYSNNSANIIFSNKIRSVSTSQNPQGLQIFYNQNMESYTETRCNADCSQSEASASYAGASIVVDKKAKVNHKEGLVQIVHLNQVLT